MNLFTLFPTKKKTDKQTNKHKKLTRLLVGEINPWLLSLFLLKGWILGSFLICVYFYWHRLRSVNNELGQYSATACFSFGQ